jgi:ubiquinol-cytochrome c reductase cytochrome b subunit
MSEPKTAPSVEPPSDAKGPVQSRLSRWLEQNFGVADPLRTTLRHLFPDHWSFFFGEIALYCFIILVATGIFLAMFYRSSVEQVVYQGSYAPLHGVPMSDAYASVLQISFDVQAGLIVRQMHHWAALVFVAALVLHFGRLLFTGAFRRPRVTNWLVGSSLLLLVLFNGFTGYSAPDDLLSGTGLRIAYSITESIPLLGPWLAVGLFAGDFPGFVFVPRIFPVHILLVPALIAGLLALHLTILWRQRHTQYPGQGRSEARLIGTPLVPAYALRTLGFFFFVAAVLFFLAGFMQVNPVWLYGPYQPWDSTSFAQPDWYTGWLEGAVRLFPAADIRIGDFLLPGIFWPAVVVPAVLFAVIYTWPRLDRRVTGDSAFHNLLNTFCAHPGRTAIGLGTLSALTVLLLAGGDDVLAVVLGTSERTLVWTFRITVLVAPFVVGGVVYALCRRAGSRPGPQPESGGESEP